MCKKWGLAGLAFSLVAQPAHAHSPFPGIEGFYVGLFHSFSTPSQALLMVGIGLLIGSNRPDRVPWGFGTFFLASLAGLLIGIWQDDLDAAMFGLAMVACALAALWPNVGLPIFVLLVAIGGALIGQVSITDPGPTQDRVITMAGSFVGANIGLLYIVGALLFVTERYTHHWVRIAIRVAAAWVGAIALVMLALDLASDGVAQ